MNQLETLDVLTAIASYDLRTVGEADAIAWHAAIGDLPKALALEAVVVHHKTSTERVKPAHILGIARTIVREREQRGTMAETHAAFAAHPIGAAYAGLPINVSGEPVWTAYDVNDAIDRPCRRCRALAGDACVTARGTPQKIPCLSRLLGDKTPRFAAAPR